jgi:hypothetical protein
MSSGCVTHEKLLDLDKIVIEIPKLQLDTLYSSFDIVRTVKGNCRIATSWTGYVDLRLNKVNDCGLPPGCHCCLGTLVF